MIFRHSLHRLMMIGVETKNKKPKRKRTSFLDLENLHKKNKTSKILVTLMISEALTISVLLSLSKRKKKLKWMMMTMR